ncbi:hypothetical protein [Paenibacillus protaetiae]
MRFVRLITVYAIAFSISLLAGWAIRAAWQPGAPDAAGYPPEASGIAAEAYEPERDMGMSGQMGSGEPIAVMAGRRADGHSSEAGAGTGAHRHEEGGDTGSINADWSINGGKQPKAGQPAVIRIAVTSGGQPVEHFASSHEAKQHLIIVSRDLSYFAHVHPVDFGGGRFEVKTVFPAGGDYRLIADFEPEGAGPVHRMTWIQAAGRKAPEVPLQPDDRLARLADGVRVQLTAESPLQAGNEVTLAYKLADEKTGAPVTDLQPYLGAIGHVVILSSDARLYLHVHPLESQGSGPEAKFQTVFPQAGIYKIWAQFKREGSVITVPFTVRVT